MDIEDARGPRNGEVAVAKQTGDAQVKRDETAILSSSTR